jgi:serine phosphatase RsbU (regulator of sigma subunit)/pSer/pThr/pTyr-binding forkhead associated (FHA) protein
MGLLEPRLDLQDQHGRQTLTIKKDVFRLGRGSASDLQLAGPSISRDHAHILRVNGEYILQDRHSRFGTFVNGVSVAEHTLHHGDRIELGRRGGTVLTFLVTDEAVDTRSRSSVSGDLGQLAGTLEALREIGAERVLDQVLVLVLDQAIDLTGVARGVLLLADDSGTLQIAAARDAGGKTLSSDGLAIGRTIPERVFASGAEEMAASLPDLPDAAGHQRTIEQGILNVLCMPLQLVRFVDPGDASPPVATIGVLYLDSRERGRMPSATARTALQALAHEAAVAIDNTRLYREALEKARMDQELRMAAARQQALLPPARKEAGFFEADGVSVPCRAVGGDFFDYMDLRGGRFGFSLADVAGKGPSAALLTAVLQGIVSALGTLDGDVGDMARRANAALAARQLDARFATAVFASLEPDGTLTYCNAGHNPPFLVRAGEITRLTEGGLVLGLFADARYRSETLRLDPGDTVVLFSDGVSEAAGPDGHEYGDDRIRAVCEVTRGKPPTEIVQALLESVRAFTRGVPQQDDLTVVAVRYGR